MPTLTRMTEDALREPHTSLPERQALSDPASGDQVRGHAPVQHIAPAAGVTDLHADGSILRGMVLGSFYEVFILTQQPRFKTT